MPRLTKFSWAAATPRWRVPTLCAVALLLVSVSGCVDAQADRAVTSEVERVVRLPSDTIETEPGKTFELGVQALDDEAVGVDGLEVFFSSSSSKVSLEDGGGSEALAETGAHKFGDTTGSGIAVTKWKVADDAAPGTVSVFGFLLADDVDREELSDRSSVLGVKTWSVEIKEASK